jgi:hypothetical protein
MEDKWADYKKKKKKFDEERGYGTAIAANSLAKGMTGEDPEDKKKKDRFKSIKSLFGG